MTSDIIAWPPAYIIKKHPRARYVKLKTSIKHGLELVVPKRFNQKEIPAILEINKAWIIKQLTKIRAEAEIYKNTALPDEIVFAASNQRWKINYIETASKKLRLLTRPHAELVLFGNIKDKNLGKKLLVTWVKQQAKIFLTMRLQQLSEISGLGYSSISIRNQRSRWGSCTVQKAINLNYKLIFLPSELNDHIILHELCHTVHMNHSASFWRLVAKFDPDWKNHSKETRKADKFMPPWLADC
jgi:predicted metal-dependent hydrolase